MNETNVYWAVGDPVSMLVRVMKVAKSGGTPVVIADHQRSIAVLALDATNIYWIDPVTRTVVRHAK